MIYEKPQVEPIVGQVLYVLNRSAEEILEKYKKIIWVFPPGKPDIYRPDADRILGKYIYEILSNESKEPDKYLAALMNTAALISDITPLIYVSYEVAMGVLNKHSIRFLKTDRHGIARTSELKPGTYYVCGVFGMNRETSIWNVKTNLKPGENYLTLNDRCILQKN